MEDLNIDNIEKLLQSEPSEKIFLRALKGLKAKEKNWKQRLILSLICLFLGFIIAVNHNTVKLYQGSIESILNILLAFFGVIFTGYSLLQAFMNKKMLLQLLMDEKRENNNETKSRLQDINENFVYLMMVIAIHIIGTLIIRIVISCTPDNFCILSNLMLSNICATLLISAYYNFTGIILWRVISFIASIYHLFNIYAVTQLLEMLDEKDNK